MLGETATLTITATNPDTYYYYIGDVVVKVNGTEYKRISKQIWAPSESKSFNVTLSLSKAGNYQICAEVVPI